MLLFYFNKELFMKFNQIALSLCFLSSFSFSSVDCQSYFNNNDFKNSFSCFSKELTSNKSFDNYYYSGLSLLKQEKYKESLPLFLNAEKLSPNDFSLSLVYNKLSFIYNKLNDAPSELSYSLKNLEVDLKLNNKLDIASSYNNLAVYYFNHNEMFLALENFYKSIDYNDLNSDTYNNLAICLEHFQDFAKAESFYKKAIYFDHLFSDYPSLCLHNYNLALFFFEKQDFSSATPVFLETLEYCQSSNNHSLETLSLISLSYIELKNLM